MAFDREFDIEELSKFQQFCLSVWSGWANIVLKPKSQEDFLNSQYSTKKAERINALTDVELNEKDVDSSLFTKGEIYLGKNPDNYKARMIWSRALKLIAHYGRYFHSFGKELGKKLNNNSNCYYISGATPVDVGNYAAEMMNYPFLYEMDVSNWDGSMLGEILWLERWFLMNKVEGFPEDIDWLFNHWFDVKGKTSDQQVYVDLEHGRRSGDLWTSSMNSLMNYMFVMYSCQLQDTDDFKMLVLGDDNVVALNDHVEGDDITAIYRKLGMKLELIERESIYETSFCSGLFWNVAGKPIWGNLPFRQFSKFGVNHHKHPKEKFEQLLYGMSKGMLCTAGHVPIFGAFLRAIADSAEEHEVKAYYDNRDKNPFRMKGGPTFYPTMETYIQFSERYGVPIEAILEIEEYLECTVNIKDFPYKLEGLVFDQGTCIDLGIDESQLGSPINYETLFTTNRGSEHMECVVIAPLAEEIEKLQRAEEVGLVQAAVEFGQDEVNLGAPQYHIFLHVAFTFLSSLNLKWGVGAHRAFNKWALRRGFFPATKNSVKKRRKKRRKKKRAEKKVENDLKALMKLAGKNALTYGGEYLGGLTGVPGGSNFGRKAGAWLSKISGMGDYEIKENSLFTETVPDFRPNNHRIRCSHREFISDVMSSTTFSATEHIINPSMVSTFPWLSKMAGLYTQYTIKGLIFEFISTSADALNSTNTALGTVVMATRYNTYTPTFTSKIEMENHEFACSTKPSKSAIHPIECSTVETPFRVHFVRDGALGDNEDTRLYDWGVFTIATVGMQQADVIIGELWVSYDIEFEKPRLNPASYTNPLHGRISNGVASPTNPLGAIQRGYGGNLELTVTSSGYGWDTINFPDWLSTGRYFVQFIFTGSVVTGTGITYNNCSLATDGWRYALDNTSFINPGSASSSVSLLVIDINASPASIQFTYGGGAPTGVDVYVMQGPTGDQWPIRGLTLSNSRLLEENDEEKYDTLDEEYLEFLEWKKSHG
jgi:hypothetical protein